MAAMSRGQAAPEAAGHKPLVGYMIVGAQKAGTTALDECLSRHPAICTALIKETHFFDQDVFFAPGPPRYDLYDFFFSHWRGEALLGEATPTYMFAPHVPSRLRDYNPLLRLVVLLRHPVERAYSQYQMNVRAGVEPLSFRAAIDAEDERLTAAGDDWSPFSDAWRCSYVQRSLYAPQIERLLSLFPSDQLLVLRTEELARAARATLDGLQAFLGVPLVELAMPTLPPPGYPPMQPADRAFLLDRFADTTARTAELMAWDVGDWLR